MKNILIAITLVSFVSCGGFKVDRRTNISQNDVLEQESLNRYGDNKIENKINNKDPLVKGLVLCYQGNVPKGLKFLKSYAIKEKDNSKYWQKVASCHYINNNFPKSEFYNLLALKNANKLDKAAIFNNLGLIYLKEKHFEQAKQSFIKSLKLNKNLKTPLFNLSQLYIQFGLFNMALKELSYLINISKNDIELIKSIAICHTQMGNHKKALKSFKRIPNEIRKRADIAVYYAQALYLAGKYTDAKSVLFKQQTTLIPELRDMQSQLIAAVDKELLKIKKSK